MLNMHPVLKFSKTVFNLHDCFFFFFFYEQGIRKISVLVKGSLSTVSTFTFILVFRGENQKADNTHTNITNRMKGKIYSSSVSCAPTSTEIRSSPGSPYQMLSQVDYRYIRFNKSKLI